MSYDQPPKSLGITLEEPEEIEVEHKPPVMTDGEYLRARQNGILLDLEGTALSEPVDQQMIQQAQKLGLDNSSIADAIFRGERFRVAQTDIYDEVFIKNEIERLKHLPDSNKIAENANNTRRFIHTTGKYSAQYCMQNGLICSANGLSTTAVMLSNEDKEKNFRKLAQRHRNGDHVVVIDLPEFPRELQEIVSSAEAKNSRRIPHDSLFVRTEIVVVDGKDIERFVIPQKYIRGIFYTETGVLEENKSFNPEINDEDRKIVLDNLATISAIH